MVFILMGFCKMDFSGREALIGFMGWALFVWILIKLGSNGLFRGEG